MSKKNLLYVITKLELGGAQKQVLGLIKNIDKDEFRIFLFTAAGGDLKQDFISLSALQIKYSKWLERTINPLKDLFTLIELWSYIISNQIDVVHTHSSKAGIIGRIAAYLAQVKCIVHTVHGWSFNDFQPGFIRRFYIWLEQFCARFTDRIIVLSEYDFKKGLVNGISSSDKYSLIRCGIELNNFNQDGQSILRGELGIDDSTIVVGMIACFKPQKAPLDFVKAAKLIIEDFPATRFILVGEGLLRGKIEKYLTEHKLTEKVILLGWRRDIPEILKIFDIFVLTSLWEGLPMVVLEAMMAGLPVVATDTGGISEVVREKVNGFLTKPHEITGIYQGITALINDPDLRKAIASHNRQALGEDFDIKHVARANQAVYLEVLNN